MIVLTLKTYRGTRNPKWERRQSCEASENMQWEVQLNTALNPNDALSCAFKYHLKCWVKYVVCSPVNKNEQTYVPANDLKLERVGRFFAEIELYALLKDLMSDGAIVTMDDVQKAYKNILMMHDIPQSTCSCKKLKVMISNHLPGVEFCRSIRVNEPGGHFTNLH